MTPLPWKASGRGDATPVVADSGFGDLTGSLDERAGVDLPTPVVTPDGALVAAAKRVQGTAAATTK